MNDKTITIDGRTIPFEEGETIMDAALAADIYIPYLCHKPGYQPHGSCKLCTVQVNGRNCSACTMPASEDQSIVNQSEKLNSDRKALTQMLFVEGNHICPGCQKSGDCQLQALGYHFDMLDNHFSHFFPRREVDASHQDIMLDRDRCILCELCVRASRDVDGKNVFALSGRGLETHLIVNSASGKLVDSDIELSDMAAQICPVGAIIPKRCAFETPIGERRYDNDDIEVVSLTTEGGDQQ